MKMQPLTLQFPQLMRRFTALAILLALLAQAFLIPALAQSEASPEAPALVPAVFLPGVMRKTSLGAELAPRINVPYFSGEVKEAESAVTWMGLVSSAENYTDLRLGYNDDSLQISFLVFDRYLWYDGNPQPADLSNWDAATMYISLDGPVGSVLTTRAYRFTSQLYWWEQPAGYQHTWQGSDSAWVEANTAFTAATGWRGESPNNNGNEDRGWVARFTIPFSSLGLASKPADGVIWGLGLTLHDRDSQNGPPLAPKNWPENLDPLRPLTWGELRFGLPVYSPPPATQGGEVTIRQGLNGQTVPDAAVGGTTGNLCPGNTNFIWNTWGNLNFNAAPDFNIQNQTDAADWPCFAKYYLTFPLQTVPAGKVILSATLSLHQFGGSDPATAKASLIQVMTTRQDWLENTLTWNNAPRPFENVSRTWADPMAFSGWPGAERTWDVAAAAAQAYASGLPLRLVLYEADTAYHSGKHFVTSNTGDWNAEARPTLVIVWGQP